jgi:hypothetical protein
MAIAIREQGNRSKVIEHIQSLKETGADGKVLADQSLMDSLKADIASDVAALDSKFNGVLVIAEARHSDNRRERSVQVIGQEGHF